MSKWLIIGGICVLGFFLLRGNGKFGGNANSDDMRATAAVSLAAGTFDSGEDVTPIHKGPRSKCEHCHGTGKIVSGDGLFKQDCPYCEPDHNEAPVAPKADEAPAQPKCSDTADCHCEKCVCKNNECLKCNGKCTCGDNCKCGTNKECLNKSLNKKKDETSAKPVSLEKGNLPAEDKISVAQAALADAAAHYKKGEVDDAARAVEFASEILSSNNFASKSEGEAELAAVQQKIVAAKRNLRNKGVDLDTVIVLNRGEYEAFLVKYYDYQKKFVDMAAEYAALKARYEGTPIGTSVGQQENVMGDCANGQCGASNNGVMRVWRYNQNFNGGGSSCGAGGCSGGSGGGCSSCGRGIW